MSWKNKFGFRTSLKVKVAVSYMLLFFISCSAVFLLLIFIIKQNLTTSGDALTSQQATDLERVYFLGIRAEQIGEILPPEQLSETDMSLINSHFPDAQVLFIYRRSPVNDIFDDQSAISPTAFCYQEGNYYELRRKQDNSLYHRRINIRQNLHNLRRKLNLMVYSYGRDNISIRLLEPDGTVLVESEHPHDPDLGKNGAAGLPGKGQTEFRFLRRLLPDGRIIEIGRNITELELKIRQYRELFLIISLIIVFGGGVIGWLVAVHFISGVRRVTRAAQQIYSGDYSHRIELRDEDAEIRELMETFNKMNARTEALMEELRIVTDDVAHDLRTPLTRISGIVELALSSRDVNTDFQSVCITVAEECARMKNLLDTMLEISRTNSRPDELHKVQIDFTELLSEAHELMMPLAEEKFIDFKLRLPDKKVNVFADKMKLQRLVANLLENAFKFTPSCGKVIINLEHDDRECRLLISDTGCGIAESDQKRIFERFFRADASRHFSGNGLGLALVNAIVAAHGWRIEVESIPGSGSVFTVFIPAQIT